MSAKDRQELPSPNAGGESNNETLQIRIRPVTSKSESLEDGEIMEGRSLSQRSPQQSKHEPQLPPSSNQVRASIPPASPTGNLAASLAPAVEPMTEEDLDRAKSLVLDLLGWGVTPEYLVECGLSSGTIYKIFIDLRLRLPNNLKVSPPLPSHCGAR